MARGARALVAALALAAPAHAATLPPGRSVEGRAIPVVRVGPADAAARVLVVGCIHGDEPAGIAVVRALERAHPPAGVALWLVPDLNPDGVAAGTRRNAHGIDLNRNFPTGWRAQGGVYDSGPRPLSEPESRFAYRLVLRIRPTVSIWFHQHEAVVDDSSGRLDLERVFSRISGLPLRALPRYGGSAVTWQNRRFPGSSPFVVELPAGTLPPAAVRRYVAAVLAVASAAR